MGTNGESRFWILHVEIEQQDHDLWCITCPKLPYFTVVGETEEVARENVRKILTQYLELNFDVAVTKIEFADEVGDWEPVTLPPYMIAEVARAGGEPVHS